MNSLIIALAILLLTGCSVTEPAVISEEQFKRIYFQGWDSGYEYGIKECNPITTTTRRLST